MKIGFTTLGCPLWDMDTIIRRAVEYGYDGVDFRGYRKTLDLYRCREFSSGIKETIRKFADAGLETPCFSTSAHVFTQEPAERSAALDEVRRYAEICALFNGKYLRVFVGRLEGTPRPLALEDAGEALREMAAAAGEYGIILLVETHDDWTSGADLAPLILAADPPGAGVVWDTHNTVRLCGEPPAETWRALGARVRYTHWKDSIPCEDSPEGYRLCLPGEGDIPFRAIFECLREGGYDGYLAFEWEKRWYPEIEEPEIAFPRFAQVMRDMIKGE